MSQIETKSAARPDWQYCVIEERYELAEKLNALRKFIALGCPAGDRIAPEEMELLRKQAAAMNRLIAILDDRIHLWQRS